MNVLIQFMKAHKVILMVSFFTLSTSLALSAVILPSTTHQTPQDIQYRVTEDAIEYRYDDNDTYQVLVTLASLKDALNLGDETLSFDISETHIMYRYGSQADYQALIPLSELKGMAGTDGREVILDMTSTHIVWKYEGDASWTNLLDLSLLKGQDGTDGKKVEFQTSDTHIQYKYEGDANWTNLILLDDIKGNDGLDGVQGLDGRDVEFQTNDTHIQWRYKDTLTWSNLVLLDLLKGDQGLDGIDGKDIELRTSGNTLQWRYKTDALWMDLYDFESLQGLDGISIENITLDVKVNNAYVLFDTYRYSNSSNVLFDDALNRTYHDLYIMPDTYNPNAIIYYSGFGTYGMPDMNPENEIMNNPITGNTLGYEFYYVVGTLSTDLQVGITYLDESFLGERVEIRVTYDVDFEALEIDFIENNTYFTGTYDESYIVTIESLLPYQNQMITIPKGSTNVRIEMEVLSDVDIDFDLGYYILGERQVPELNQDNIYYLYTFLPQTLDIDYQVMINNLNDDSAIDPLIGTPKILISTATQIIYDGNGDVTGDLSDLGIGQGFYRFYAFQDNNSLEHIIIDGTLDEPLYVYIDTMGYEAFEFYINEPINDDSITWIDQDQVNVIDQNRSILTFDLSDGSSIDIDLSPILNPFQKSDLYDMLELFYDDILFELEMRLPVKLIRTAEEFQNIAECLSCDYVLKSDIDLSLLDAFIPIGTQINPFIGSLDGNGYKIINVPSKSTASSDPHALFAYASDATFKHLYIINDDYRVQNSSGLIVGISLEQNANDRLTFHDITIKIDTIKLDGVSGLLVGNASNINMHVSNLHIELLTGELSDLSGIAFGSLFNVTLDASFIDIYADGLIMQDNTSGFIATSVNSRLDISYLDLQVRSISTNGYSIGGLLSLVTYSSVNMTSIALDFSLYADMDDNETGDNGIGGMFGTVLESTLVLNGLSLGMRTGLIISHVQYEAGAIAGVIRGSDVSIHHVIGKVELYQSKYDTGGLIGVIRGFDTRKSNLSLLHIKLNVRIITSGYNTGGLIGATHITDMNIRDVSVSGEARLDSQFPTNFGGFIGRAHYLLSSTGNTQHRLEDIHTSIVMYQLNTGTNIGGFYGYIESPHYDADTNTYSYNGELVTDKTDVEIFNATSSTMIYAYGHRIGGYIGYLEGGFLAITNSTSSSYLYSQSSDYLGGFIGFIESSYVTFNLTRSLGSIYGEDYLGGFIGYVDGSSDVIFSPSLSDLLQISSITSSEFVFDVYGSKSLDANVNVFFVQQRSENVLKNFS